MGRYSIDEFIEQTSQKDRGEGLFELETERLLEVNLNGDIWTKMGSMVAYVGDIKFVREKLLEKGLGKLLKKGLTGEGGQLTKASGRGRLYLADAGKKVSILDLDSAGSIGGAIHVNGNDILAFETQIEWDIKMMKRVTAMLAGGLFNVRLEGRGLVAITTHYDPITLAVKPGEPVITDPNATVAWSASLQPELKTDVQLKTLLGRGSGESIQMRFEGDGFVVIQPYEEVALQTGSNTT